MKFPRIDAFTWIWIGLIALLVAVFCCPAKAGVRVTLHCQGGFDLTKDIQDGWNTFAADCPMSVASFPRCLRIGNDIAGPGGTVFFTSLEIDFGRFVSVPPRKGWVLTGNVLTIGNGQECFPPRSSIRVRYCEERSWRGIFPPAPPAAEFGTWVGRTFIRMPVDSTWVSQADSVAQAFLRALETGEVQAYTGSLIPTLREPGLGLWRPHLLALSDGTNGGGHGIEPIPWERTAEVILYHDAAMERHAVGWRDRATGEPAASMQTVTGSYSLVRYWRRNTVPEEVSLPASDNPYDERRVPRHWNAGTCEYEAKLAAVDAWGAGYNGFPAHDGQHLIRATYRGKVAAEVWGDACAADDLRMIAQDAKYAWPLPVAVGAQAGSGAIGREWAWMVDSLVAGRMGRLASRHADSAKKAQMPNGFVQRAGYPQPWIPDAWSVSPDVPDPLSQAHDAAPTMEAVFIAHALNRTGCHAQAAAQAEALLEMCSALSYGPRFVAVGDHGGLAFRSVADYAGPPTYFNPWTVMGEQACLDPEGTWMETGLDVRTPTQGQATSMADLKNRLRNEQTGRSQVVAAFVALGG